MCLRVGLHWSHSTLGVLGAEESRMSPVSGSANWALGFLTLTEAKDRCQRSAASAASGTGPALLNPLKLNFFEPFHVENMFESF